MKIYFIRHGQSTANINHFFAGQTQVELTEEGREQAKHIGTFLKRIKFDKVYCSDLIRAIDTQKIALPEAECEISSLLREVDVGELAGISLNDCLQTYGDKLTRDRIEYNFAPYGGENCMMFKERIKEFLEMVSHSDYKKIAVFCHGGFISVAAEYVIGDSNSKNIIQCENCSVSIFDYTAGKWTINLLNFTGEIT